MNRMLGAAHGWRRCGDTDGRPSREAQLPNMRTWRSREDREWTDEMEKEMTDSQLHGADAEAWGVPDGTEKSTLPTSYFEWLAEGSMAQAEAELRDDTERLTSNDIAVTDCVEDTDAAC